MESATAIGRNALSRPPVATRPASEGRGSTWLRSSCLASAAAIVGWSAKMRPSAPETCGVAIEVPLRRP
jgi:hypothetical protein